MEIQEQRQGAVTVLKPSGPLNQDDAEQFRQKVSATLGRSMGRLVVDATAVPFADSRGLEVLVEASHQLEDSGQVLRLSGVGPTLREVLELTGLSTRFEFFEDANQAVRSFL